jgi:hypothetical protein
MERREKIEEEEKKKSRRMRYLEGRDQSQMHFMALTPVHTHLILSLFAF